MKPNKAPGPDGIPGKILALVMGEAGGSLRYLFTRCLRGRSLPLPLEKGEISLPPEGREGPRRSIGLPTSLSIGREVSLSIGKLMERVLVGRLNEHLQRVAGLNERQFGFRAVRSTIDAIDCLRARSEQIVQHGRWRWLCPWTL